MRCIQYLLFTYTQSSKEQPAKRTHKIHERSDPSISRSFLFGSFFLSYSTTLFSISAMSAAGPSNAWDDDDWESQADVRSLFSCRFFIVFYTIECELTANAQRLVAGPTPPSAPEKKVSSKVTKAQRRAQQAEFNRQLWAEAYVFACGVVFFFFTTDNETNQLLWMVESNRRRSIS